MRMNTLDKERLDQLIEFLQHASAAGFSSISSPLEILLESGTDICLVLSKILKEGRKSIYLNPKVIFPQGRIDSLGNPLSVKVSEIRPAWKDLEASEFLKKLALYMVGLKNRRSHAGALTAAALGVGRLDQHPQSVKAFELTIDLKQKRLQVRNKQRNQRAYFRRQRNKESTSI